MEGKTRYRRLDRLNWVDSGRDTLDFIKSYKLEKPIAAIVLRFAFRVTSTAGGTVAGFTKDASVQLLAKRIELVAHHQDLGETFIINMAGPALGQFWHLVNDIEGRQQDFTDPAPTVSSSLNGFREFRIPLDSPWAVTRFGSRVDPRHLAQLQLKLQYGADADYAVTNLSDIDLATVEVGIDEIVEGIPEDAPYFVPSYKEIQQTIGPVTSTDLVGVGMVPSGLIPLFSVEPFDASAAGDAQRNVPGLIRRLSVSHDGREVLDKQPWNALKHQGEKDFSLAFTTTRRDGPVTVLVDRKRNFMSMIDAREKAISAIFDTSSSSQQGTTDVTAAAGDRANFIFLTLLPTRAMKRVVHGSGYKKPVNDRD